MKRQVRRGVFETNSSSVHSLTMCSGEDYSKWEKGEYLYLKYEDRFETREKIIEEMKTATRSNGALLYPDVNWNDEDVVDKIFSDKGIKTCNQFFDNYDFETFEDSYTTPNGEKVVAFGYYGEDR